MSFGIASYGQHVIYLRDLLYELVVRDVKVRYKRSALGVAWSLINPLLLLSVFHFVFRIMLSVDIPRYSSFAFSGIIVWGWFQSSIIQSSTAITGNSQLIKCPGFPAAILPVVIVTTQLIYFLMAFPVLVFFLMINGISLKPAIVALPIVMVLQFGLTLSLGYLVATANVLFRDTQHLLQVLLQLLFFLSPVFYDASVVPAPYQQFYRLNPMVHLIDAYRAILMRGTLPEGLPLLVLGVLAMGLLYVGVKIHLEVSSRFVEEL